MGQAGSCNNSRQCCREGRGGQDAATGGGCWQRLERVCLAGNPPGHGGRGAECQGLGHTLARHSGLQHFQSAAILSPPPARPRLEDCVGSRTVSARVGAPEGWGWSPPAWGHGQNLFWDPVAEASRGSGMGGCCPCRLGSLRGWGGGQPSSHPWVHPLVSVGPRWVPGVMRPQGWVAPLHPAWRTSGG